MYKILSRLIIRHHFREKFTSFETRNIPACVHPRAIRYKEQCICRDIPRYMHEMKSTIAEYGRKPS